MHLGPWQDYEMTGPLFLLQKLVFLVQKLVVEIVIFRWISVINQIPAMLLIRFP
jgi:hypothetical protein